MFRTAFTAAAFVCASGLATSAGAQSSTTDHDDPTASVESIRITGVIRDFKVTHPDFESYPGSGQKDIVMQDLGSDGKPVLNLDKAESRGWGKPAGVTSEESFNQWYRDVPGVNVSMPLTIELQREYRSGEPVYVFAKERPEYFFPIDSQGYGLSM
ncbi:MAG: hypothetical protein AAFS11_01645, partial [Planctomycetota bacterium]